jgi:hypothetical protein
MVVTSISLFIKALISVAASEFRACGSLMTKSSTYLFIHLNGPGSILADKLH